MDFFVTHQLNMELFMSGMCGILAVMTLLTRSLPRKTKSILTLMELSAMLLLLFDRFAYIYKDDPSAFTFYMVRISNGIVFFMSLLIPFLVTRFINDLFRNEGNFDREPLLLRIADVLFFVGVALLIIAQFTRLYYYFDEQNVYHRTPYFAVSYLFPSCIVLLQECTLIRYRKRFKPRLIYSLIAFIALPPLAAVVQLFVYGASFTIMMTALVMVVFYTYELDFLGETARRAKEHEIELYKETQKKEADIFEQTTEALANAIDAKDNYTHGHSARVAIYSKRIAKEAGLSDEECERVYFAALLHDVGKIGVRHDIINKPGKLTDEEYEQIKAHPALGDQILSSIKQAPFLRVGARSHHERYDGRGYPDNLSGENIPELARIIAVADAYDAMTSARSYRKPLDEETVRAELKKGMGTQFDPQYAEIMLRIMDEEKQAKIA